MHPYVKYAIAGTIGVGSVIATPFAPLLVSMCLAGDGDPGSRSGYLGGNPGAGFRDDTCCSNMAYTANARYRINNGLQKYQPQPFFKGQILTAFGRDIIHALGLDQPAQRGDWTVGGFGFGAVTHEMRGPGGTIGPI